MTNYKTILDTPTRDNWFRMCYRCFPEKIVYSKVTKTRLIAVLYTNLQNTSFDQDRVEKLADIVALYTVGWDELKKFGDIRPLLNCKVG